MTERDDTALDRAVDLTLPTGAPSPASVGVDPTSTSVGQVDDDTTTEAGTGTVEAAELLRPEPAPGDPTEPAPGQPAAADGTAAGDNDGSVLGIDSPADVDDDQADDDEVRTVEVGDGLAPREALPDEAEPVELAPVEGDDERPEVVDAAPVEDVDEPESLSAIAAEAAPVTDDQGNVTTDGPVL